MQKCLTLLAMLTAIAWQAACAAYPERPIRVIVPFAPGGNVDLTARTITPGMSERLGQSLVVDNRAGAGGAVGAEIVADANPDGYTLLVGSTGLLTIAPTVFPKLRYNPLKDFAAISLISDVPLVMMVNAASPAKSVRDFIAMARAHPGRLTMASSGNFSTGGLAGALFQNVTGTRLIHVPYRGGSLAAVALMGGQVDVMFDQMSSAIGHIRSGKLRPLAVTSRKRLPELPSVPTMQEAGATGVEASTFTAILAPARTPRAIIAKLHEVVNQVLATKAAQDGFAKLGSQIMTSTPQSAQQYIGEELAKWAHVIHSEGIKAAAQ